MSENTTTTNAIGDRLEVTNRSIPRVQQLSKKLAKDVRNLELFGSLEPTVLFASRDPDHSLKEEKKTRHENGEPLRWYNFRLCANDGFSSPAIIEYLKKSVFSFEPLFNAAAHEDKTTRSRFKDFRDAVENGDWLTAYDQFVIALAVIPYRGVLLHRFREFYRKHSSANCCFFRGPLNAIECKEFGNFKLPDDGQGVMPDVEGQINLEVHPELPEMSNEVKEDLFNFILPFTRREQELPEVPKGKLPYPPEPWGTHAAELIPYVAGIAVPAFDTYCNDRWSGGMAGWLVLLFSLPDTPDTNPVTAMDEIESNLKTIPAYSWSIFTQLIVPQYVRDVRRAHMMDLVEEYAENTKVAPDVFFRKHLHHLCGWMDESVAREVGKDVQDKGRKLQITFENEELNAVFERDIVPLWDTRPLDDGSFPYGMRRLLKDFLEALRTAWNERQAGITSSGHNYSKDLNAVDIAFGRLRKVIEEKRRQIPARLQPYPELQGLVSKDLESLQLDYEHSSLRTRFMMAHLRVRTEGRLYEQPQWCMDLLSEGTRGSIYQLIRHLVWEPLGANRYRALAGRAEPTDEEVAEWSKLFAYDETGNYPELEGRLAQHLKRCFFAKMSNEDFGHLHPPPRLNPHDSMNAIILSRLASKEKARFFPGRLLPLFVFAMRASFQHAWLTSFLKASIVPDALWPSGFMPVSESINLEESPSTEDYAITVRFPNPLNVCGLQVPAVEKPFTLPWGGWADQIKPYRRLSSPWQMTVVSEELPQTYMIRIQMHK